MMMTTGHSTAPGAYSNHANSTCGPCHAGNPAGGYRLGSYSFATNGSARQYGCTQCHDAVGAATNSVAFPHGNRDILYYQWDVPAGYVPTNNQYPASVVTATPTTVPAVKGNLWMYQQNIAQTSTSVSTALDARSLVIQGAVGPNANGDPGNIMDGVCLKCHAPIDSQSKNWYGVSTIVAGHHSAGTLPTDISTVNPYSVTTWLYLWR